MQILKLTINFSHDKKFEFKLTQTILQAHQSLTRVSKIRVLCTRVIAGYEFVYVFSCVY